ncbi:MAG TPA: chromate resistance protein ChrB domain-containing protein [Longimicrobiales bacterium]
MAESGAKPWLLLIHQVPAKPDYLRVKVWRRLRRIGAVNLKHSVWALPTTDDSLEDFHWLLEEIAADGGEGLLCEASFLAGLTEAQQAALTRLREVQGAGSPSAGTVPQATSSPVYRGRLWVTRPGVYVDRIASAWLIRRHIDPEARFRFAPEQDDAALPGQLRFDTFGGEFTHRGDRCTFEVLAAEFAAHDPVVARLGRIVHDIDFKDGKYGAPETPGFARALDGICARLPGDLERIERGSALLDDLYAAFAQAPGSPADVE